MTPEEFLTEARRLMPGLARIGDWSRVCALLIRVALEGGLRRYWTEHDSTVVSARMSHQLLALRAFADPKLAAQAAQAWYALCHAAHHHAYELGPTPSELDSWHAQVGAVLQKLHAHGARGAKVPAARSA